MKGSAMPFLGKHPANYYTNKIAESAESCLELLNKYSIHPPDDADSYTGVELNPFQNVRQSPTGQDAGDIKVSYMDRKIAYLGLVKAKTKRSSMMVRGQLEGGKTLYGEARYVASPDKIPVYWLPWDTAGAIISLHIPAAPQPNVPDPDRFFTAAINGCSVFFQGNQQSPIVFHAGGSTGAQPNAASGAAFWRGLVTQILGGAADGEVNKTDYITDDNVTKKSYGNNRVPTTQAAKDYKTWLKNQHKNELEIKNVDPWACVMGIRDANRNWTFYMQENATTTFYVLKKKYGLVGKTSRTREKDKSWDPDTQRFIDKLDRDGDVVYMDKVRSVSRPICVSRIFPNPVRGARIDHALPTWSLG